MRIDNVLTLESGEEATLSSACELLTNIIDELDNYDSLSIETDTKKVGLKELRIAQKVLEILSDELTWNVN